jgi:hypothetical protein
MRDWADDPDLGTWVNVDPETGVVEIDVTGPLGLRDGMTVTVGEKPYLARVGFGMCLVANCACVRGVNIQLVPLDSPFCVKDVRRLLVSVLKQGAGRGRRERQHDR